MLCAISGTVPEEPVVSKKSGLLFERRLIEKVMTETGRCPITDEPLDSEDLVAVSTGGKGALKPRPAPATSVPGLLSLLQNEWDATVLEAHQLRAALHAARQELSHALYQHDAATRVIARLLRERDEYRARLEAAAAAAPAPAANGKRAAEAEAGGEEPEGKKARPALGPDVLEALTKCSTELSKGRKKREIPPGTATPEDIAGYSLTGTHPLHATRKGGILAVAVSGAVVATGGADTNVGIFDRAAGQTLATLKGHSKKVLDVAFVGSPGLVASASADKTVRLWRSAADGSSDYSSAAVLNDFGGDVVAVEVHPTNDYLLTASSDGVWGFYDVARAETLARVSQDSGSEIEGYTSAALHPDGLILCTGGDAATVRVWETRQQKCVAKFQGHVGAVSSLSFSENGYYMASAAEDGVKLWDLRKLKNFQSLETGYAATSVAFDRSGLFLAVGGADARVYGVKQDWGVVKTWEGVPKKGVHAVAWAPEARALLVGAADHNLRVFS